MYTGSYGFGVLDYQRWFKAISHIADSWTGFFDPKYKKSEILNKSDFILPDHVLIAATMRC